MMKTICAAVATFVLFLPGLTTAQTIQINRENKTIAINTSDEASSTADIAAVNIGFEVFSPDSQTAYAEASRISHAVMDALKKAGVDSKSIESKTQTLNRNNNFDERDTAEDRAKKQFHFQQSWEVSVSPQNAANVLHLAVSAGANQGGDIEWRLSGRKDLQAKAAANALVKARAVATQMAEGLHVRLGPLIYASNETPNAKIFFARPRNIPEMYSSVSMASVIPNTLPLEIRPQLIREEATVYAVFAIE
ncbi:SIMPL domain-containing protein [Acidicapsa ligni]|uniref:SIMPL domain-containing protein n=1 Tax=Acidicapsa ligni TaxID=542300 RepID=UPI0021E0D2F5|nr:SIMPL domain-containing protein [Acidicapsa ligni]